MEHIGKHNIPDDFFRGDCHGKLLAIEDLVSFSLRFLEILFLSHKLRLVQFYTDSYFRSCLTDLI